MSSHAARHALADDSVAEAFRAALDRFLVNERKNHVQLGAVCRRRYPGRPDWFLAVDVPAAGMDVFDYRWYCLRGGHGALDRLVRIKRRSLLEIPLERHVRWRN
jgi:hypothetical protein